MMHSCLLIAFGTDTQWQITPVRIFVGTYMTSLDGKGFSITLLRASEEMLDHLDGDVEASGWSPGSISALQKSHKPNKNRVITEEQSAETEVPKSDLKRKFSDSGATTLALTGNFSCHQ